MEAPKHVIKAELIFPVVGHSFIPTDRVFAKIEFFKEKGGGNFAFGLCHYCRSLHVGRKRLMYVSCNHSSFQLEKGISASNPANN